jgi:hypothetical protein
LLGVETFPLQGAALTQRKLENGLKAGAIILKAVVWAIAAVGDPARLYPRLAEARLNASAPIEKTRMGRSFHKKRRPQR